MSRGPTKAQLILNDARNRVLMAEGDVHAAERELDKLKAVLEVHRNTYNALEKALARKLSRSSTKRPVAITKCSQCDNTEGHALHQDKSYGDYHPFVSQPPAPGAGKRSSSKRGAAIGSTASAGEQPENALAATGD